MSTFEVVLPILVAFHTQSLRPHLRVRKTLYLVNPFRIKSKVTLNIGLTEVLYGSWPLYYFPYARTMF